MKLKISRAARDDLAEIGRFGAGRWSPRQAQNYTQGLLAAIMRLADNPWLAPAAPGIKPDLRRMISGSHAVFYRIAGDSVMIVRVLHHSRDVGAGDGVIAPV